MSSLTIRKGKTYSHVLRWGVEPIVYAPITSITKAAPMVVGAAGHGLIDGWPTAIVSVVGMDDAFADDAPKAKDYRQPTVIDADTVEFNRVNAANLKPYKSGGYLQYFTPADLTGANPRMVVLDKFGGTIIASSDAAHVTAGAAEIALDVDDSLRTITFTFSDEVTAAFTQRTGVFEAEIEDALGNVHYLDDGDITFIRELAT